MQRSNRSNVPSSLCVNLVLLILFGTSTSLAQQRRPMERGGPAVFPPLTSDAAAQKERMLESVRVAPAPRGRRPNIVLLLADDLGYGDTGCYGSTAIPTPHIDRLAKRGVRFTDAYVTAGSCSPSRAALLTGRYQQRFGFEFNTGPHRITEVEGRGLDPTAITIADVLRQAGFVTGCVGKWHLGSRSQFHPNKRGFDEFFGFLPGGHTYLDRRQLTDDERAVESGQGATGQIMRGDERVEETEYLTDAFAREAVDFIDRHRESPFFLYVPFNAVHTPIQATGKYKDRFAHVDDLKRRTYYAMTSALNDAVGKIVAALEANDLTENTLVIFFNDNGGPLYTMVQSNRPLRLGKLFLFEGGIRVPLIMSWPGTIPESQIRSEMASTLDLFPTICTVAGIQPPADLHLDGANLIPALSENQNKPLHDALFWRNGTNRAVRAGDWKLVQADDHVWLFDLSTDVGETHNLAGKRPEVVGELKRLLSVWESELRAPAWPHRPNVRSVDVDGIAYKIQI